MSLDKAKTILIIAFAGLNLFLGYYLFWPDFGKLTQVAVTADDLRLTEAMLNDNNYFLAATIDRSVQFSDFITVAPAAHFQQQLLMKFIDDGASIGESGNARIYRSDNETAVVYPSGLVRIYFEPAVLLADDLAGMESRDLADLVESFLDENNLKPAGIRFDYLEKSEPGRIALNYYQVDNDIVIYASQLKVIIVSDQVSIVEIYWLETVERDPSREMELISATEALTSLVNKLGPSPEERIIEQMSLGFFSGEYDAEKWEIPPVWRIVLDDKKHFYINAFTGNIEQDIVFPDQQP